ncbi:hypothetical protein [Sphaerisporangium perillae]|uniref:hypothetical protein n=1 Tax=Sphaerisporangium perillae TaxID=2935860 RepID=UPI002010AF75|nr:hypothetical protein [Sphaerisporangium perillae]
MSDDDTVSEKRACEDADSLAILQRRLSRDGIRCRVFLRMRLILGTETIPPQCAYNPTELIVYGADGKGRAKVTVRTKLWGTTFLVTPVHNAPGSQFPTAQISQILPYLSLLARDELHVGTPATSE